MACVVWYLNMCVYMYIFKFYSYVYWSSYHVPDAVYCLNKQNNVIMKLRSIGRNN